MPSGVNSSLSGFIQSISRLSYASQASRAAAQAAPQTATRGGDRLDLTSSRQLSDTVQAAVTKAQNAQGQIEEAQTARRTVSGIQSQLSEMRSLAQQASSADLKDSERAALAERFNAIQSQVNRSAQGGTFQGQALNERLFANGDAGGGQAPAAQVQVRETAVGPTGTVTEEEVALAQSQTARESGVQDVRLNEAGADAVFRFQDSGSGTVTVTRYNRTADGLEEAGSQTVALSNFRNGQMTPGASETLNFDRLGLQVDINQDYAAGDLNRVDVAVQTPEADRAEPSADTGTATVATSGEPAAMALDISTQSGAAAAASQLDQTIASTEGLAAETRTAETNQRQNVASAFREIASEGLAGLNIDTQTFERQVRATLLGSRA